MKKRIISCIFILAGFTGAAVMAVMLQEFTPLWFHLPLFIVFVIWGLWTLTAPKDKSKERKLIEELDSLLERMVERKENASANELKGIMLDYLKEDEQ